MKLDCISLGAESVLNVSNVKGDSVHRIGLECFLINLVTERWH